MTETKACINCKQWKQYYYNGETQNSGDCTLLEYYSGDGYEYLDTEPDFCCTKFEQNEV